MLCLYLAQPLLVHIYKVIYSSTVLFFETVSMLIILLLSAAPKASVQLHAVKV